MADEIWSNPLKQGAFGGLHKVQSNTMRKLARTILTCLVLAIAAWA
jgi:hypothetical protein